MIIYLKTVILRVDSVLNNIKIHNFNVYFYIFIYKSIIKHIKWGNQVSTISLKNIIDISISTDVFYHVSMLPTNAIGNFKKIK